MLVDVCPKSSEKLPHQPSFRITASPHNITLGPRGVADVREDATILQPEYLISNEAGGDRSLRTEPEGASGNILQEMTEESTDRSIAERLHATLDGYRLDVSEMQQILVGTGRHSRHPAVYLTNRLDGST